MTPEYFEDCVYRILDSHESQRSIMLIWLAKQHPEIFEEAMAEMVRNSTEETIEAMEENL